MVPSGASNGSSWGKNGIEGCVFFVMRAGVFGDCREIWVFGAKGTG